MGNSKENRCAVFAHYDADCIVDDYVLYYLNQLAKVVECIVFVSDCDLPDEELLKISTITDLQISGRHGEYDFGSYKRGYQLLKKQNLKSYDELVFCNDSCYGPLSPLSEMWDKADGVSADVWGLTWGTAPKFHIHIQSFFLVFKKRVFSSEVFSTFMISIKAEEYKMDVVEKYEVGLSKTLITAGFNCRALLETTKLHSNPSIGSPFKLIEEGFPFLKVALLRENPLGLARLYRYQTHTLPPLKELIQKNLERTAPNYQARMHYRFTPGKFNFIHPKLIRIKLRNKAPHGILIVDFLGIQILKLKFRS